MSTKMTRTAFVEFVQATFNAMDMISPAEGAQAVLKAFEEYEEGRLPMSTDPELAIIKALSNMGIDTECGACMEIAFTGVTTNAHSCREALVLHESPPARLITECCGRSIAAEDRFCPKCGYECRVQLSTSARGEASLPVAPLDLPDIEVVSVSVHQAWIDAKLAQGITSRLVADGTEQMVPYADLPDALQELDPRRRQGRLCGD